MRVVEASDVWHREGKDETPGRGCEAPRATHTMFL
jgi:hypothetical protein